MQPPALSSTLTARVASLPAYTPGRTAALQQEGGPLQLASNENALGPSPRALAAAAGALGGLHRYPDPTSGRLRAALAARLGVAPDEVVVGNGLGEVLELLVRACCEPGDEVLAPAASFLGYRIVAAGQGARYREAARGADHAYDVPAILAAVTERTRVVLVANPDNPTGVYLGREALAHLAEALPAHVLLVVDEAYRDYAAADDLEGAITLCARRERLAVGGTFSKIHGLAGARCGWAVVPAALGDAVARLRLPFSVSTLASELALAALEDEEHVARSRALVCAERPRLRDALARLGLRGPESQGNFLLLDVAPHGASELTRALLSEGVLVRPLEPWGLPHHVRVTVGTAADGARLVEAMTRALAALSVPR